MAHTKSPHVVGLYGLPGSGKSTMKAKLADMMDEKLFKIYEGTEKVLEVFDSSLEEFKKLDDLRKTAIREQAIKKIGKECASGGDVGIVTGHFSFWSEENDGQAASVCTTADLETYTCIIYLEVEPKLLLQRISDDTSRPDRKPASVQHLSRWQEFEKKELRKLCYRHDILFFVIRNEESSTFGNVETILQNMTTREEEDNWQSAKITIDEIINHKATSVQTMLVIDADKTLAPFDTGKMFWQNSGFHEEESLTTLFDEKKYSYYAFRQAELLYEEFSNELDFDARCMEIANAVVLYPEFASLLHWMSVQDHIDAIIVTCGISQIWTKVLERIGLSSIAVIGNHRAPGDRFVVTPILKGEIVEYLQGEHQRYVYAFGDSPTDEYMLCKADQAIVVVGDASLRSKSMEEHLANEINEHGFRARQILLPGGSTFSPRLDGGTLPVIDFSSLFDQIAHFGGGHLEPHHATRSAASKLLATEMRDRSVAGPALRAAHHKAGYYLAVEHVSQLIGLERFLMQSVSGQDTWGHRLAHEARTVIVACMRGGEPMALGVSEAFPLAMFVHAGEATELEHHHLQGRSAVIVVDSVINEGGTIVKFVERIRELHHSIRIVVVAGVVQADAVKEDGKISMSLHNRGYLDIVALRLSENKYTGSGGTDTGNRLFNTTYRKKQ